MSLLSFDYLIKNQAAFNRSDSFTQKLYNLFGISVLSNTAISLFIYPFDTIKRRFQVNGGLGFNNQIMTFSNEVNNILSNPRSLSSLYR